jgi:hypothetical protein
MTHTVVRVIELLVANALAAAVTIMFVIAVIAIVHAWRAAGRQH